MDKNNYMLVYGSLRQGQYNNGETSSTLATIEIKGWQLYDLGPYPGAVFTGEPEDTMVVELIPISTNSESRSIDYMELGAGYHVRSIMVPYKDTVVAGKIYEYLGRGVQSQTRVLNGDWTAYLDNGKVQEQIVVSDKTEATAAIVKS